MIASIHRWAAYARKLWILASYLPSDLMGLGLIIGAILLVWVTQNPEVPPGVPLYATVIIAFTAPLGASVVGCRRLVRRADLTDQLPRMPISPAPDPWEIAYLRDGETRAAQLAVLSLLEQGYLELRAERHDDPPVKTVIAQASGGVGEPEKLPGLLHEAWTWFQVPIRVKKGVKGYEGLPRRLGGHLESVGRRFQAEALLTPEEVKRSGRKVWAIFVAMWGIILVACTIRWETWLGIWPAIIMLALAALQARQLDTDPLEAGAALLTWLGELPGLLQFVLVIPFMILILLLLPASPVAPVLILLGVACYPGRVSKRGKAYLRQLQVAYARPGQGLGGQTLVGAGQPLLMAIALSGSESLQFTPYDFILTMFESSCGGGGDAR